MGIYIYTEPEFTESVRKTLESFSFNPLISVVMPVYNVEVKWLELAIDSLQRQWYTNWELCSADDASTRSEIRELLKTLDNSKIKIVFLEKNVNISAASNAALALASGEYIALMDHDDELSPDALYEVVKTINQTDAEFIYSDEDKLEIDGRFTDPHFKSDWNPDMFLSQNYISHLGVIKKRLVDEVGGWSVGLEGSQDYDLYLKVLEHTDKIAHIPKVLYHWRKVPGSTAAEFSDKSYAQEAGGKALVHAMKRRGIQAEIHKGKYPGTYRVKYQLKKLPLVSIVIPFKDKPELLDMCINSILDKSSYANYEIIGISNNSKESETFEMMKILEAKDKRVSFYEYNIPFNYSKLNNHAVTTYVKGSHIILLNNDIEIITPEWIESMLEFSQRANVGAVGAKLYYPDDTIQHAGISMGVLTLAGHNFRHLRRDTPGYMGRESSIQNVSAVTAACLMVKKSIFTEVRGLDEENLKIAFNDVDFCLRIQERGYLNVYTPYCEAYHYESISRGKEDSPEKVKRFNAEVAYMKERYKKLLLEGDPYYNQNLTLECEDFTL
jgi:glycosyltransferase involved in cell wall biosynthesis